MQEYADKLKKDRQEINRLMCFYTPAPPISFVADAWACGSQCKGYIDMTEHYIAEVLIPDSESEFMHFKMTSGFFEFGNIMTKSFVAKGSKSGHPNELNNFKIMGKINKGRKRFKKLVERENKLAAAKKKREERKKKQREEKKEDGDDLDYVSSDHSDEQSDLSQIDERYLINDADLDTDEDFLRGEDLYMEKEPELSFSEEHQDDDLLAPISESSQSENDDDEYESDFIDYIHKNEYVEFQTPLPNNRNQTFLLHKKTGINLALATDEIIANIGFNNFAGSRNSVFRTALCSDSGIYFN